jgi:hypothetical protein
MANRKISDLTSLTAPATGDLLPIVDISEAAAADKNKKITYGELLASAPAGTAAAPSFSFDGDPNSGLYSAGADQVAITTGGTGRLFVNSTGQVSVGTTSTLISNADLSVIGTGAIQFSRFALPPNLRLSRAEGSAGTPSAISSSSEVGRVEYNGYDGTTYRAIGSIYGISDGGISSTSSPGFIGMATTPSGSLTPVERLRISSAGLVGIGVSAPASLLHLGHSSVADIRLTVASTLYGNIYASASDTNIYSVQATPLIFGTNNTERLRITPSGAVGIASSSPWSLISVGNSGTAGDVTSARQISVGINSSYGASLGYYQTGASSAFAGVLQALDGGAGTGLLLNPSGGNVGIGATNPQYKLDISPDSAGAAFRIRAGTSGQSLIQFTDNAISAQWGVITTTVGSCIFEHTSALRFTTASSERARIDSSGRLLVGTSTALTGTGGLVDQFQIGNGSISVGAYSANQFGNRIQFTKSRNATTGSQTVVQNGDILGYLEWAGSDGTNFDLAARITAEVDGTPGSNDMPGRLVFSTTADGAASPTERLRITNAGYLLFNHTNSTALPGIGNTNQGLTFEAAASNGATVFISRDATCLYLNRNSDGGIQEFRRSGTTVGSISVTATATAYNTSSDYRLKENVVPLTSAIDRINDLQVRRFNFKADQDKTVDGFLAHEAQAVVPECVTGEKDAVDADGKPVYQGIDQSKLVPLLTAALQEAIAKIETLEARLTAAGIA